MLKQVPLEEVFEIKPISGTSTSTKQKSKKFEPELKNTNNKSSHGDRLVRKICIRFIGFVNRGKKFTFEQIDDLILGLQRVILHLQKQKHTLLREEKHKLYNKKNTKKRLS
jgi:hypothetical protein